MARGPYQGTYIPGIRPTVVHAPDALVFINGESDVIGCPSCRRKFDFNRYITQISVDLNIDSPPGSANINLSIPRHTIDDFYFDGNPVITPMMEVEIYAKGYFLVEGVPQYYPIFWGMTTEVNDAYSGGEHTVTLNCSDILKWWELCKMNINPAFTGTMGQMGRSIFGNVFFGKNPYDVIWTLAQQAFGDVVVGSGSLVSLCKEKGGQSPVFQAALSDIMAYWQQRFSRIRSNLLLYGTNGVAVRGDSLTEAQKNSKYGKTKEPFASTAVANANGGMWGGQMVYDPADPSVVAFRTDFGQAGQVNFWQSEYQTKLELANAAKEAAGFEFYMDVTGDIVFKPPFYNLDILGNKPLSWIQDIDVIDWDFSESEAEVVTQLQMQGSFGGTMNYGMPQEVTPFTSVTDYHLLRKYGWRTQQYNSEFMGDPQLMFYHGMDLLDRMNSRRHRGTVSIPLRPELRLGFPVYIAPKDQIWYLQGLSHSISMGSRAQTTLTLTAKRSKFLAPRGIGKLEVIGVEEPPQSKKGKGGQLILSKPKTSGQFKPRGSNYKWSSKQLSRFGKFKMTLGAAASMPPDPDTIQKVQGDNPYDPLILRHPKTGRIVGYPNVVMVYTRPFSVPKDTLGQLSGQKPSSPYVRPVSQKETEGYLRSVADFSVAHHTSGDQDDVRDRHLNNRFTYGLNSAGVFVYSHDASKAIQEVMFIEAVNLTTVMLDPANVEGVPQKPVVAGKSGMIRPVSDERGFEVIGQFRYGRGISLRDGQLISSGPELGAEIRQSLAISGDLFATLSAQSSGLTSIATTAPNPSDAVARLQPEDFQTAAFQTPGMSKPEFAVQDPGFIDKPYLGSGKDKGYAVSVEAGQLSRALTLAEMSVVKELQPGSSKDVCACILSRSDLAFINTGYQVSLLKGTVPAQGSLFNANSGTPGTTGDVTTIGGSAALAEAQKINEETKQPSPVSTEVLTSATGLDVPSATTIVNNFLFGLYQALDTPHQRYEQALRGELLELPLRTPEERLVGEAPTASIKPPYSPGSRLTIGDPRALALQVQSNAQNLSTQWKGLGDKLKSNRDRTYYQGLINRDEREIQQINRQIQEQEDLLRNATSGGSVVISAKGDAPKDQIRRLNERRARLEQQVQDNTLRLNQLPTT
jgi:hypothetical protein